MPLRIWKGGLNMFQMNISLMTILSLHSIWMMMNSLVKLEKIISLNSFYKKNMNVSLKLNDQGLNELIRLGTF